MVYASKLNSQVHLTNHYKAAILFNVIAKVSITDNKDNKFNIDSKFLAGMSQRDKVIILNMAQAAFKGRDFKPEEDAQ